jgi:NAD(P)-dependent dehydrogenase (short-subunit alcohol dehydrogenase family)
MKTMLITGVTGAIGKATAMELAKNGHKLIMLGRNKKKLEDTANEIKKSTNNQNIETIVADLADLSSVKKAAETIKSKYNKLDGLINIAAIYKGKRELTKDGFESMFGTNHMGPFVLTKLVLPLIEATPGARILTVSAPASTKLNFEDLNGEKQFSAFNAFGASKMANHLFTYALSRRLNGIGSAAMVFHPGITRSDLTREMPAPLRFFLYLIGHKPEKPAKAIVNLMTSTPFTEVNGKFYDSKLKELKQPGSSGDFDVQEKLWTISEKLSGLETKKPDQPLTKQI